MARVKIHISELNLDLCPICNQEGVTVAGTSRKFGTNKWFLHTMCHSCGEVSPQTITSELKNELLQPNGILKKRDATARHEIQEELAKIEKWDMKKWADRFVSALSGDHILPEDF